MDKFLGIFTSFGLSTSAGLNAYLPLLIVSLVARFTDLIRLNEPFDALESWWAIGVLVVQTYTEGLRYSEEDKNLLKFVCDQIAMVIHRKKSEEDVQESERFLTSMFESIQDGISILGKDYTILRVNKAMEGWYAHAMPLVGKKCYEAYHLRDKACEVCPTRKALETSETAYEIVDKVVTQSSDREFHCLSITIFYTEKTSD